MEAAEHIFVGDSVGLDLCTGEVVSAQTTPLLTGTPLTYGNLLALGGDFYGTGDLTPISSSADPEVAFEGAWSSLLSAASGTEVQRILAVMRKEQSAVAAARAASQQPSTAYLKLGDSLSLQWNEITGGAPASSGGPAAIANPGRYLRLALVNMDHFGVDAVRVYQAGHAVAMRQASRLRGSDFSRSDTRAALLQCYACNAFADHFLSDLFASGHLRTPRRPLYAMSLSSSAESGRLARYMHDQDNSDGVWVSNLRGERWLAYGDGKELDQVNAENLRRAIAAVQDSVREVTQAAQWGQPTNHPVALDQVPDLAPFIPQPVPGTANHAPLFWADGDGRGPSSGYVYRRGGPDPTRQWTNVDNYNYSYAWSAKVMLASVLISDLLPTS